MSQTVYTDLPSLILLYQNGDLPADEMAWSYQAGGGKVAWAHKDELQRLSELGGAYPSANTQRGKK